MPVEITRTITAYKFSELSKEAKDSAIQKYGEPYGNWYESVYDVYKEEGKALGFAIDDIYFSGFWSQGDGASWKGTVDLKVYFEKQLAAAEGTEVTRLTALVSLVEDSQLDRFVRITQDGRYSHEMTMSIADIAVNDQDEGVVSAGPLQGASIVTLTEMYLGEVVELEKEILEDARNYARKIYAALEEEYDGHFDPEYFAELAEANNWLFDEKGKLV